MERVSTIAGVRTKSAVRASPTSQSRSGQVLAYVLLSLGGLVMFMPFVWLLSSSVKGPNQVFVFPPEWIPNPIHWDNYAYVVQELPFLLYLQNTMIITVGAVTGQVLTSMISAYSFARLRWWGRDVIFALILSTLMLPYVVTLIPIYVIFTRLHWINTFLPLIVPTWFGGGAFNIFLLRQFFLTIPRELEEAAIVDGAQPWTLLRQIIVPLSKPALAVVAIFSFLHQWNDFLGPLIYLNKAQLRTLALGVNALQGLEWGRDMTQYIMAISVLITAPVIILFFVAQRSFIEGIVLTGLRG
ncbi:MAG TPA: carbohydrate ABC transporter permease [Chloroflexota bacterium]|nr:carbohydrate ABC transporter permease [Chloroflexota bacterium]